MDSKIQDSKIIEPLQDDLTSVQKVTQSYLFLKKKICETHEVIKQYNDKLKECERLRTDLDAATAQTKKITCNYNTALSKVIKLELQNREYEKSIETLKTEKNEYKIKTAADQQHIQQLICKVKDLESHENDQILQYDLEKSSLQVKVKELEQELRIVKKSYDMKIKKIEKKIPVEHSKTINKVRTRDIGITATLDKVKAKRPDAINQCTMTDEFYSVKNDVYPLFCAKCEILLEPVPLEKICKIMTNSCPQLIEKISSPPRKVPTALRESSDNSNERCKTENTIRLLETASPQLENRENHVDFISTNAHLSSHAPIALNSTDFCDFQQPPSSIHQNTCYAGSAPVNPLSFTNLITTNQVKNRDEIGAIASSLSIISSLQKRIDTLELKIENFSKRKLKQDGDSWQHVHQNPWCMYDINNSMQLNFMEMWKKMTDLYGRNNRRSKCKPFRLKSKKRLQSACTGNWKVEMVAKRTDQSPFKKWSMKRKHRHAMQNSTEALDKSIDDSDTNSCDDKFHNRTVDTNVNTSANTKSSKSSINIKTGNALETSTGFSQSSDMDDIDVEEAIRTIVECYKSIGGETDSGILSDSVESNKLAQLEGGLDICLGSMEVAKLKSSKQKPVNEISLGNCKFTKYSPTKEIRHISKAGDNIEQSKSHDNEMAKDENELPQLNNLLPSVRTKRKYSRKRKLSETQELKKVCNRGGLLKKIRNLKRSSKIVTTCQSLSDPHEVQNCEHDNVCTSQEKKHLDEVTTNNEEDYLPKKRPRIAHVPRNTIEQNASLNKSRQKNNLIRNGKSKLNRCSLPNNDLIEKIKIKHRNSLCLNRSSSVEREKIKQTTNIELQNNCNSRLEEVKSNVSNVLNDEAMNGEENGNTNTVSIVDIKSLKEASFNMNDLLEEVMDLNELKTESNNKYEHVNQEHGTNSLNVIEPSIGVSNDTNGNANESQTSANLNFIESNSLRREPTCLLDSQHSQDIDNYFRTISIVESNCNQCDDDVKSIIKNEQFYDCKSSLMDSEMSSINGQKNDETETNLEMKDEITTKELCSPLTKLQQYIAEPKCPRKSYKTQCRKLLRVRLITDKFVKVQLQKLVDSNWETSIHWDVIEKLKSVCTPRIIAKGIIDFLSTEQEFNVALDNSHSPPAPLMTKAQQRIAALLVDLDLTTFQFVQAGIEYKLFHLTQTVQRSVVESLTRMYVALARIKKDREKVRIFCCDALYCLGLQAIPALYIVFTCWPEVFPNQETNTELLPKCMAHLIITQQAADYPKLKALKNLVSVFYKYPMGSLSKDILNELLAALQDKYDCSIETAIILLAKREGTMRAYKNIIQSAILPMIVDNKFFNEYRAFSLLGNLMRAFPIEDKEKCVERIVQQLCDLINLGDGSDEQQEGAISALLSLSRHKFDKVVQNVIKWNPNGVLKDRTTIQLRGLFIQRPKEYWKVYLRKKKFIAVT